MIPRKIHFVWVGPKMPAWGQRNIDEFKRLNPGYKIMVHDETSAGDRLRPLIDRISNFSSKADLIRLDVLQREGGWYFDLDTWPLRPVREAEQAWNLDGKLVFVSRQKHRVPINNCVIAAGKNAEGLEELIHVALRTTPTERTTFGPDLFSRVATSQPRLFEVSSWPWWMPLLW